MNIIKETRRLFFVTADEIIKKSPEYKKVLKDKHLFNKSFYLKGNNKKAIILVHGWSSTPYSIRKLGEYLNKKGYTVVGPMLLGHGSEPKNLMNVSYQEWENELSDVYKRLSKRYKDIFVGGSSMGANLAVLLAKKHKNIAGLILLAMPYRIKSEIKVRVYMRLMNFFGVEQIKKYYPKNVKSIGTAITPMISYQSYPIKAIPEFLRCINKARIILKDIRQPCLVVQSVEDHMIVRNSMEKIYFNLGSKVKEKKYVYNSYHSFISDKGSKYVFRDILKFIKKRHKHNIP